MSEEVKLEEEWVAKKEAIREAARRPPPRPPLKIAGVIAAVLLLVGAVVGIALIVQRDSRSESGAASGETVRIEVRSMPAMEIKLNGRKMGRTPLSLRVPKSDAPITLEASYVQRKYSRVNVIEEPRTEARQVVPDRDRTVDFTAKR
jgi:hypothetical protein